MAAKRIFISYSRRDTEYVSALVEALRKQGFEVWFDKNIRTGSDWDDTIEEQLKAADAIVLVLSKTSVSSENVKDEMSYAMGLDKTINPIKIEECAVPMRLARKQFVDFTTLGHEAGFERLVNDLKRNLELVEENKSVPKGTFKPPVAPVTSERATPVQSKKKLKIALYIIGAVVAILFLIGFFMQGDDNQDQFPKGQEEISAVTDPDWEDALNSNSIDNYIKYIKYAGPDGEYINAALDSIHAQLPYEGMVLFQDGNGNKFFSKLLFSDANGDLDFGVDNNLPPRKFDILTALGPIEVWDEDDKHIIEGANIVAGDKVEVLTVEYPEDNSIWIKIGFSD